MMTSQLRHIALIPDGNRRWARAHGLPPVAGHRQAVAETLPALVHKVLDLGIPYFTIWGFSTENWGREASEVEGLMKLFDQFYEQSGQKLADMGVRIAFIGRRDNLSEHLQSQISRWTAATSQNDRLVLTIAFNYGGRDEILRAINKLLERHEYSEIGEQGFSDHLDTSTQDIPDPDLIIRPGGEKRLSGFMSWQAAYSELYFCDKMLPEFTPDDLQAAIDDFYARQRRYGK